MSVKDLIGWGSVVLFVIFFVQLYRLITAPSKRLEKLLGEGSAPGLQKVIRDSAEWHRLVESLSEQFGTHGKGFRVGSVYKAIGRDVYLVAMVTMQKVAEAGGSSLSTGRTTSTSHSRRRD